MVWDALIWVLIAGIIGARIFYVIQFPGYYFENPLRVLKIWEGGLIYYGGLIGLTPFHWGVLSGVSQWVVLAQPLAARIT